MNAAKYSFVRTALSSPNRYLLNSISESLVVGVDGIAESLIAIQSGLKFDCRHPAKVVMLGRVLRPASAIPVHSSLLLRCDLLHDRCSSLRVSWQPKRNGPCPH